MLADDEQAAGAGVEDVVDPLTECRAGGDHLQSFDQPGLLTTLELCELITGSLRHQGDSSSAFSESLGSTTCHGVAQTRAPRHRILLVSAAIALFPGCGQAAQHQRRVPPAPSPAEADRLALESVTLAGAAGAAQAGGHHASAAWLLHQAAALQQVHPTDPPAPHGPP